VKLTIGTVRIGRLADHVRVGCEVGQCIINLPTFKRNLLLS
jgi:hypothetical protein